MTWTCGVCGLDFQPSVGHDCVVKAPTSTTPKPQVDPIVLTLLVRLEKLARENEFLRMQNDILKAKKEMK